MSSGATSEVNGDRRRTGFERASSILQDRFPALRRRSDLMPITVPNYSHKTDRFQFGTLIGITSES